MDILFDDDDDELFIENNDSTNLLDSVPRVAGNDDDGFVQWNNISTNLEGNKIEELEKKENWANLQFQTVEEVHIFYRLYSIKKGFTMRKDYAKEGKKNGHKTNEVRYIRVLCNKEGSHKPKTDKATNGNRRGQRTKCKARILFHYSTDKGLYFLANWVIDHNHELVPRDLAYLLKGNRKMTTFQRLIAGIHNDAGMRNKSSFEVMVKAAGGVENLGFLKIDLKNWLGRQRQRAMKKGEATALLKYFRDEAFRNPSFYYEVQVDIDEQISNIFWADKKMRLDYQLFGDAIVFDTTYRTNKDYRPLGLFVGFNNHRETSIFGAALMFDETTQSFEWLFNTFLRCMENKAPKTIFTDQAQAIANAVESELAGTYHALCTWHILENAKKRLSHLYTRQVSEAFRKMIYDVTSEEEFDLSWNMMVEEYFSPQGNDWLNWIHGFRKKWSSAWVRQHFTAGMVTTQLAESCNANVKRYLQPDYNLVEFFTHFNNMVNSTRNAERQSDYNEKVKLPLNKHHTCPLVTSGEVYTHKIFLKFQHQYEESISYLIEEVFELDNLPGDTVRYRVFKRGADTNVFDARLVDVQKNIIMLTCSCRMYETLGILCRHVMKVMTTLSSFADGAKFISLPDHYILRRWTKKAKEGLNLSMDEPKKDSNFNQHYQHLTYKMNYLATLVSLDWDDVKDVDNNLNRMIAHYSKRSVAGAPVISDQQDLADDESNQPISMSLGKTIKKRNNPNKSRKRFKSISEEEREKARKKHQRQKRKQRKNATVSNIDDVDFDECMVDIDLNQLPM